MEWFKVFQVVLSLVGVIGLIFFMLYMLRKVNKYAAAASGSRLRILDRAVTGRETSLLVVSVSGKLMLIGVSTGKIEKLCDLEISEEEYYGPESANTDKPAITFASVLSNYLPIGKKKTEISGSEGEETNVEAD